MIEIGGDKDLHRYSPVARVLRLFGLCVSFGAVLVRFGASLMSLSRMLLGLFMVARFMVYAGHVMMFGGLRMKIRRN
jgi:hypothetical protein